MFNISIQRKQNKRLYWLVLFAGLFIPVLSQPKDSIMDLLVARFDSLAQNSSRELVYIQTSKGIYETGEDIWFKAYILNSQFFTPSDLSKTLYLQVVNEKTNIPVWQEKYEIQNGFANGHVFLHDTLSEGEYCIEAFTSHSFFNDRTEFKAIRKITVKKDMAPRASFTANFDKQYYNQEDTFKVTITARSEKGMPLYAEVEATLMESGKELSHAKTTTNRSGDANLSFILQGAVEGLCVVAHIKYEDKEKTLSFPVPHLKGSPIQFNTFPEGGNMIAGIPCKIAFKAVDAAGNPLEVSGILFENNTPLLEFESIHAGMGSFNFTPGAGNKYHIRLTIPATDSTFLFPEVYPQGITIHLAERDEEYLVFIVSQNPVLAERTVYVRGQMRGQVYCMAAGKLNEELKIKIPLKEFLQQGIAEFTLFDENLLPVAERLVFINQDRKLYIKTDLGKEKYGTREKVTLTIKTTDENDQPVTANLGLSVFDKLYQNRQDPKNVVTYCYLSSQLKGKIYDPAYYFDKKNDGREEALDLLLLTHGWRRYTWNEENLKLSTGDKKPVIFDWTEGEVKATRKQKKAQEMQQIVMAFNAGENDLKDFIVADSKGRFKIMPIHLKIWQGEYVYLKPMAAEDIGSRINLDNPFQTINNILDLKETIYPLPNKILAENEVLVRPYVVAPNVIELGEVTVKGKGAKPFRDKYMGQLDSIARLELNDDYVCKQGYLNCRAHVNDTTNTKPIEGEIYNIVEYKDVNGITIVADAYIIEYHYPKFTEEELLKMNNLYRVKAYYSEREFYQPNYDKESENDFLPDTRNTLVWAPSVITNEKGEATLEIFCSDVNTGFIGNIEGVSADGLLGTKNFEFTVQKLKPFKWESQE